MTIEQILEIIERYKLRIPPTVYYDLLADVQEVEEEQEPKSEWQQDHEILKAYSDGANEVLDKIRAEIVDLGQRTMNDNRASGIWACRDIIDKYKAESEDT